MKDDFSFAAQVLEQWGAKVSPVQTSHKDESDWLVEMDGFRLLVEEKIKLEDPESRSTRAAVLARAEVYGSTVLLSHHNRLSGIVRKAVKQLDSTANDVQHNSRIVWFTGTGFDAEAKHYQFMATLYGSTRIFELSRPGMKECYYFRNADFFRFREQLDGAVVAFIHGSQITVKLCLNTYSSRCDDLRKSPFAAKFKLGLVDPAAEEAAGEAYVIDTDISRSDTAGVIRFLETKYGLEQAQNMDMNLASALVTVRR